jgi:hypothetical protein
MTDVELADSSLGVATVVGLTTTACEDPAVLGMDGGAVVTDSDRTVICGSDVAFVAAAPEVEGGFAVAFDARSTLGLGFGAGVVGAAVV